MSQPDGVVFVYRSHYEGLLSKRVRRLPDRTVLDWFRRGWTAASDPATDLDVWVATELGGRVYGLASIFDAARERELPAPATANELGAALAEHLYVEGEVVAATATTRPSCSRARPPAALARSARGRRATWL